MHIPKETTHGHNYAIAWFAIVAYVVASWARTPTPYVKLSVIQIFIDPLEWVCLFARASRAPFQAGTWSDLSASCYSKVHALFFRVCHCTHGSDYVSFVHGSSWTACVRRCRATGVAQFGPGETRKKQLYSVFHGEAHRLPATMHGPTSLAIHISYIIYHKECYTHTHIYIYMKVFKTWERHPSSPHTPETVHCSGVLIYYEPCFLLLQMGSS